MEFISNTIDGLNWWAVIVATLATMPVGFLWYSMKMGFGEPWAKMSGLKLKDIQSSDGMVKSFTVMLIIAFLSAVVLACLQLDLGISGFADSLVFGLVIGLVFRAGAHFIHDGYAKRPDMLTLINGGHDVVSMVVMSVILGVWL